MKKLFIASILSFLSICSASAQNGAQDVFTPIAKYIQAGDYDRLSAWFADNLEIEILGSVNNCTRNQAKLIMKDFFSKHTPKSFNIIHKSGKAPMKYAVGSLIAGGEKFKVILFVKISGDKSHIEQIKVEKE